MTSPLRVSPTVVALAATLTCEQPPLRHASERVHADRPSTWVPPFPELRISPDEQPQVSPDGGWIAATWIEMTRELWRQKLD